MKKFTIAAVALSAVLASTAGLSAQNYRDARGGYDNGYSQSFDNGYNSRSFDNGYNSRSFERSSHFDRKDFERRQREERLRLKLERERMRHHHDFFVTNHGSHYRY